MKHWTSLFGVGAVIVAVTLLGCARKGGTPEAPGTAPSGQKAQAVQEAAVAGLFYPQQKDALEKCIDGFLADASVPQIQNVRGLVSPHAGYPFSGPTAAFAYKTLIGRDIRTVIVMAPTHYALFEGAAAGDAGVYRTPLGDVKVSPKGLEIAKSPPFALNPSCRVQRPDWWRQSPREVPPFGQDTPHTWEHSVEVQLPFLQKVLKDFSIVPIVFGQVDPAAAAAALAPHLDENTLLVASSDLSHYHPYDVARKKDGACVKAICDLDIEAMAGQEACGDKPILTLMHIARQKGWKARLLDYRNSGDTTGEKSRVVGYAAIAFFDSGQPAAPTSAPAARPAPAPAAREAPAPAKAPPGGGTFTPEERKSLLNLARRTLKAAVVDGKEPDVDEAALSNKFKERKGCFVTLMKAGKLRGCIGYIFPQGPLYQAVIDNARNAALRDARFAPVRADEIDDIHIEVSVLTVPQKLEFSSPEDLLVKLHPREDGVVLQMGRRQATFLPQVWEQIPQKEEFLNELAVKAGCPSWTWKMPATKVLIYHVEAFKESE